MGISTYRPASTTCFMGLTFTLLLGCGAEAGPAARSDGNSNDNSNDNGSASCSAEETACDDGLDDDCDGLSDCEDTDCTRTAACWVPSGDADGDGLTNQWEADAGDSGRLDPWRADSNGNGTPDGDEDYDGDGLSVAVEFALTGLPSALGTAPHPFLVDLLVELDTMSGLEVPDAILAVAASAFASAAVTNIDGSTGVGLHFYRDQSDVTNELFDGSFSQRNAVLAANGPQFTVSLPSDATAQMVHVLIGRRRSDLPDRGGEAVSGATPAEAGVILYLDAVAATFPTCGFPTANPPAPDISYEVALANTLTHEIGHALQLGHESEVDGFNGFNVMAVPGSCLEAQQRFRGYGNDNPSLGAIEALGEPGFSHAAVDLMSFDSKLSADTGVIDDRPM